MNTRNEAKIRAANLIQEMVECRLEEARENYAGEEQEAYENVLKDIHTYKMIVRQSDKAVKKLGRLPDQQVPGMDY